MANKTDIMRLLAKGVSQGVIASQLHCSKTTVSRCAQVMRDRGIDAEALTELDEAAVRQSFFPRLERTVCADHVEPDFESVCKRLEINRKLTLKEIWFQYSSNDPQGKRIYSYSQFCRRFSDWSKSTSVTQKMRYVPGQVVFLDWAGLTGTIANRLNNRRQKVYMFVACLPYSAMIYAEGFLSLTQEQWLEGHMGAFEYFEGVPSVLVPDRCSTAVDRTPAFVTRINQTYFDFADHYGTAVNPARVGRPRDKNMVESAVDLVERWVIASLAEEVFYSLEEYNEQVRKKVEWLNLRPFQQKDGSRRSVFAEEESEALSALPPKRFELARWGKATLAPNSHVKVDYMFYSAPYQYLGKRLDIRKTATRIDVIADGMVIATHRRLFGRKGQYSTIKDHMPSTWGLVDNPWTQERFIRWAEGIGPATREAISRVLASRVIVEQAFVPCQNILGLAKRYGRRQVEEACAGICEESDTAVPTYTAVKEKCIRMRRSQGEQSLVHVEEPSSDRLKSKGRTRGAEHYRLGEKGGE
jgi:hypothetical protein